MYPRDVLQEPSVNPIPNTTEVERAMRASELQSLEQDALASSAVHLSWTPKLLTTLPSSVDYSPFIGLVRQQGGAGCFIYSIAACWDIMNARRDPYTPNVSTNRMQWAWVQSLRFKKDEKSGEFVECRPGLPTGGDCASWEEYVTLFGCPSESTELSDGEAVKWPTPAGDYEAPNFRFLSADKQPVTVDVNEFKKHLSSYPIAMVIITGGAQNHVVACVGYDDVSQRFKYLNSAGDRWSDNGFGYIGYANLQTQIQSAHYHDFRYVPSIPSARIHFRHGFRQDVYVWLGVEGRTSKKRISPSGQRKDTSRNLNLNVTLPEGFSWPPSAKNRLTLSIFDSGEHFGGGGELVEFTAAFCGEIVHCQQTGNGTVRFETGKLLTVTIP